MKQEDKDIFYMQEALKEAERAYSEKEVPVGAVLVMGEQIIARGHNRVEQLQSALAHAEMLCLEASARLLGNWRLNESTLYSTLEPCSMCAGALLLSRVKRVVWGCVDKRHGANGSWVDLFSKEHPTHTISVTGGVCQKESEELLIRFFRERREEKKEKMDFS